MTSQRLPPLETCIMTAPDTTPILSTLMALVVSMENATAPSPAATAFHSAIRRKGGELAHLGGPEALTHALAFVRDQSPAKAEHREGILTEAWSGNAGWRQ